MVTGVETGVESPLALPLQLMHLLVNLTMMALGCGVPVRSGAFHPCLTGCREDLETLPHGATEPKGNRENTYLSFISGRLYSQLVKFDLTSRAQVFHS